MCKYCQINSRNHIETDTAEFEVFIDGVNYLGISDGPYGKYDGFVISYCPMCGRKLTEAV